MTRDIGCRRDDAGIRTRNLRDGCRIGQFRKTADFDVRRDRKNAVAQFELKAVHHRQHDDERGNAERDAGHRDQCNERDERVATRAFAGACVAQADGNFVRRHVDLGK